MILIKNGRVMDPETGFDKVTDLVLSGGKIKSIGNTETADFEQIIDAEGCGSWSDRCPCAFQRPWIYTQRRYADREPGGPSRRCHHGGLYGKYKACGGQHGDSG